MPTLNVWLKEPEYRQWLRISEGLSLTGAECARRTLELVIASKKLRRELGLGEEVL